MDAKDCVSAIPVASRLSRTATDGTWERKVRCGSCVGVVKAWVEAECVSVGISASWPSRAAVCSLCCSWLWFLLFSPIASAKAYSATGEHHQL